MPIGLSPLAMIRADFLSAAVAALLGLLQVGCDESRLDLTQTNNKFCAHDCTGYQAFRGQRIHIEVEQALGGAQVFYNVDPENLKNAPIVLSDKNHISGQAFGVEAYLNDPKKYQAHDKSANFFDILAIPLINGGVSFTPKTPSIKSRLRKDGGFDIDLLAGLPYVLILNPNGYFDKAPIHVHPMVLTGSAHADFHLSERPSKISGRVRTDDEQRIFTTAQSLMRARVVQGTRLVSSVGTVSDRGNFVVEIAEPLFSDDDALPINLIIEPRDNEIALPKITKRLTKKQLHGDLDMGNLSLGTLKKPISLTIEVRGSDDSIISNAFLYLNAQIGAGETLVKKQVDAAGVAQLNNLYEGHYDIAIVPPFESKFAMRVIKDVEFDSQEHIKISFDLQKREILNAEVFGHDGKPVSGALIEFSRIGEAGLFASEDIYDDMLFKLAATTNDKGQLCHRRFGFHTSNSNECSTFLLDDGRYLAHIIPPAGTELAHQWLTFDFPEQNKIKVLLDKPEVLGGQIMLADQKTPAKRVFVTVYLAEMNAHNQPKMIGNAITNEEGFFTAFVGVSQ